MSAPTSYAYQWLRAGAPIAGATGSSYTVQSADQGNALSCQVTASNAGGSSTATTAATNAVTASSTANFVANPNGGTATPTFSEDFNALDLVTPSNTGGLWAAGVDTVTSMVGARDPSGGANSWDANPNQDFGGSVGVLNPYSIVSTTDSNGVSSNGTALRVTLTPSTSAVQSACGYPNWGGLLATNADHLVPTPLPGRSDNKAIFGTGMYIEWRVKFDQVEPSGISSSSSEWWPAVWMYGAEAYSNGGGSIDTAKDTAEVDLLEYGGMFTTIWWNNDANRSTPGYNPYGGLETAWTVYGFDWQTSGMTFYKNGTQVGSFTDSSALSWLNGAPMSLRFDFKTSASSPLAAPASYCVDNVRVWPSFAASRA